jgi:hypothetical protein
MHARHPWCRDSLANATTVDQCSQPYARVDYAVWSCSEKAMSNSLPKLSWLPDFDGRKRLYRPLNKNKQEIRVVEISPDVNRSAPLSCVLRTISIQSVAALQYNALSYYWGSTLDLETVTVYRATSSSMHSGSLKNVAASEPFCVPITKTLAGALRQFRASQQDSKGPLALWTDAICINQLDPDERGRQVAIMRKIYIAATSVWIWLGESDNRAEKGLVDAFGIAQYYQCEAFIDGDHNMKPNSTFIERAIAGVKDPVNAAELHDLVQSVGALAGLPYWYRGWTIQEATASGTVRLHYGTSYCHIKSWATLASCLDELFYPLIFYLRRIEPLRASLTHLHSWTSTQICYATSETLKGYSLVDMNIRNHPNAAAQVAMSLTIFSRSNHWQTADQRDRMLALMGAMGGFAALGLRANYKTSIESTFEKATVEILRVGQSWSHLQFFHPSVSPFLPSWVIDFTRCINMENYASANLLYNHSKRWTAAGTSRIRMRYRIYVRPGVLRSAGFLFDEIIAISSYNPPRRSDSVVMLSADTWSDLWHEYRRFVYEKGKYHDQDIDCVRYRTWCGGMVDDQPFGYQHFEAAQDGNSVHHTPLWSAINNQVSNRRFVVTKQGYISLVPDSSQVGDRIAILASGSMPFVLRKVETPRVRGDAYIMVGGCYVDGESVRSFVEEGMNVARHTF